ncbi:ABC transporter transmembrane domain-containing protein [Streptomyces johnsoniae]|uniref:ABC transporter transmembrane domain-containing protein n=1 Tax=Streptomyces johnsoniae TaxID=3075532 RepID=UPI00374E1256
MADTVARQRPAASRRFAVRSLLRLWPYVRPVRRQLISASLLAIVASCLGLALPLVLKWMVDGPVRDGDTAGVWLGGGLLLLLGAAEAGIFGVRRRLVARPLAAVEASMREAFLRHIQQLPLSAHDRWPPGQLLSRGTADLQSIHVFLAVPLTFLPVNVVTLLVGCVLLLAQQWLLGLVFLASALPLLALGPFLESRYARASRQCASRTVI